MKKVWGGRFTKAADQLTEEFGASVTFDWRLVRHSIGASIAHATMLAECGIVSCEEGDTLVRGLREVWKGVESGSLGYTIADEDVQMNVEKLLGRVIGPLAGKLHTARSRNDQVAVDTHLWLRDSTTRIVGLLLDLAETLVTRAEAERGTVMPGYTHLQRAQPILFSHHLLAYVWMLDRDVDRFIDSWERLNISPLGAAALAGTTFPIDRERTAELLGFHGVYENSLDAVSDRDYILEFMACAAILMSHLSRLCEECILWASTEFGFVEFDDAYCTGSSIMPQKKNPDMAELIRGKSGRVYGSLMSLLVTMKGLPLAYNKDMQEDKEALFDVVDTLEGALPVLRGMLATMIVRREVMERAARADLSNATDLADYLATRGVPFRESHEIAGRAVRLCVDTRRGLHELSLDELRQLSPLIDNEVYDIIAVEAVVGRRTSRGGTAPAAVEEGLARAKRSLAARREWFMGCRDDESVDRLLSDVAVGAVSPR